MAEVPMRVLQDRTLPSGAKVVLTALWARATAERRFVWPSRETLAQDCAMQPRTVRKHLATLRGLSWITEAKGVETAGNPGWYLCDPPGTPQKTGIASAVGVAPVETERPERAAERPERAGQNVPTARTCHADRHEHAAPTLLGSSNRKGGSDFSPTVQESPKTSIRAAAEVNVSGWAYEFDVAWRAQDFGGVRVSNPALGARRIPGLQEALHEHGGDVVRDVLLYAGHEAARHLREKGKGGLDPRVLAVAVRLESPSFPRLLDDWQRATQRKRASGKIANPPAEIEGIPLTDDEARLWMTSGGDVMAIVARRKTKKGADFAADLLEGIV